jgi:hypothetical protein
VAEIRCCVIGEYENGSTIFNDPKIKIYKTSNDISLYEAFTLNTLYEDSLKEEFNVVYLHTKGVTKYKMPQYNNIRDWINYMCYFLIQCHGLCLRYLEEYDAVGVNLQSEPMLHYSGNFWWSKSSYIRRLKALDKIILTDLSYYSSEMWIAGKRIGTYCSLWESKIHHYILSYPENQYMHKEIVKYVIRPST